MTGHSVFGLNTMFLRRASSAGADGAAAAPAFEAAAEAAAAAVVAWGASIVDDRVCGTGPAVLVAWGPRVGVACACGRGLPAPWIARPQLPQKRASAGTDLLQLGQF